MASGRLGAFFLTSFLPRVVSALINVKPLSQTVWCADWDICGLTSAAISVDRRRGLLSKNSSCLSTTKHIGRHLPCAIVEQLHCVLTSSTFRLFTVADPLTVRRKRLSTIEFFQISGRHSSRLEWFTAARHVSAIIVCLLPPPDDATSLRAAIFDCHQPRRAWEVTLLLSDSDHRRNNRRDRGRLSPNF